MASRRSHERAPDGTILDPLNQAVCEVAREALTSQGLRQQDVVDRSSGVLTKHALSNLISGKQVWTVPYLREFAEIVGVPPSSLLAPATAQGHAMTIGTQQVGGTIVDESEWLWALRKLRIQYVLGVVSQMAAAIDSRRNRESTESD